jgi:hypothetical protein
MRDPRHPIPSPKQDPDYWTRPSPPPAPWTLADPVEDPSRYDPTRLLRPRRGDNLGIDRRNTPRVRGEFDPAPADQLISSNHRRLDAVLGLRTTQGFAVVRGLTMAQSGILIHLLDLLDPELDQPLRVRGQRVLAGLAPLLGAPDRPGRITASSPLATVGTCLLAKRVVADIAAWASPDNASEPTSRAPSTRALTVGVVVPPSAHNPMSIVEGELVALNDPNPQVLAVSMTAQSLARLERLVFG